MTTQTEISFVARITVNPKQGCQEYVNILSTVSCILEDSGFESKKKNQNAVLDLTNITVNLIMEKKQKNRL